MVDDHLPELQPNLGTYINLLLHRHVPVPHSFPTHTHLPSPSNRSRIKKKRRIPRPPPHKPRVPSPEYVPPPPKTSRKPHISDPPEVPPEPQPQPPPKHKKYNKHGNPPPPPDYPYNSATKVVAIVDQAVSIAEGSLTVFPGYAVRIMGSPGDHLQIYEGDYLSSFVKRIASIHGDADILFRRRDILTTNNGVDSYLSPGTYDMKGPSNFWYSWRDLASYPPFST